MNFWTRLPKPFIGLSPMDGVTDAPCRKIATAYGKPDVIITEFTHVQGLWVGKPEVWKDLLYDESERPIVAQLFGSIPEYFYNAAIICCELGFDGIDINMGCPANNVVKKGGGASLIANPGLALSIIRSVKAGVKDWVNGQTLEHLGLNPDKLHMVQQQRDIHQLNKNRKAIPVSVKTRLGIEENIVTEWVKTLLEAGPDAITIHGRTLKQLYTGQADWQALSSVSTLIHQHGTVYIGNGDVLSLEDGKNKAIKYGMDGVLIGRASWGNPWVFSDQKPSVEVILHTVLEHMFLFLELKGHARFHELKKHFGWYCKGFEGAKELRIALMTTENEAQVEEIIKVFLSNWDTLKGYKPSSV